MGVHGEVGVHGGWGLQGSHAGAEGKEQERCMHTSRISQADPVTGMWAQRGCQGTADKVPALRVFQVL